MKNFSDKSNKNEVYEQMEIDNLDIKLIQKTKNTKKTSSKKINKKLIGIIMPIIIFFLILLYLFYNNRNKSYQKLIKFKNITLNYKIDYKKNIIRNYRAHRDFEALLISQFPSGNFIIHDEILIIIYDNNFKELQKYIYLI